MVLGIPSLLDNGDTTPKRTRKTHTKKAKPIVEGFDVVASIINTLFYAQLPAKHKQPTGKNTSSTAFRHLSTISTESINRLKKNAPYSTSSTPASHLSRIAITTPLPSTTYISATQPGTTRFSNRLCGHAPVCPQVHTDLDCNNRNDACTTSVSSTNRGMKRLKIPAILCLRKGDEFTCVIPLMSSTD